MPQIHELDQSTINQIAAGEVVDRPSSIVKELMENAIDAGATAITVEIKEGGIRYIRITDNGCGIAKEQIPLAFKRHTTSKIRSAEDLLTISSLGFRGEALSSIAAISQVELITKTKDALTGISYRIEGGEEKSMTEIGAPDGTTFLIQNVFYNTPARLKFLKSSVTEGNYINELVERMALANPSVAIHFINNGQTKLQTTGNGNLKEVIYIVFGREIAANVIPVQAKGRLIELSGFLGKPVIARGNRSFENYFINGRYIRSSLIAKAIETAYQPYMMQHRYPFVTLHLQMDQELLDVNVHPAKMEVRFKQEQDLFREIVHMLSDMLSGREFIPDISLDEKKGKDKAGSSVSVPEPFEQKRSQLERIQELAAMGGGKSAADRGKGTAGGLYYVSSGQADSFRSGNAFAGRGEQKAGQRSVTEYRFDFVSGEAEVLKRTEKAEGASSIKQPAVKEEILSEQNHDKTEGTGSQGELSVVAESAAYMGSVLPGSGAEISSQADYSVKKVAQEVSSNTSVDVGEAGGIIDQTEVASDKLQEPQEEAEISSDTAQESKRMTDMSSDAAQASKSVTDMSSHVAQESKSVTDMSFDAVQRSQSVTQIPSDGMEGKEKSSSIMNEGFSTQSNLADAEETKQQELFPEEGTDPLLSAAARTKHKLIGQLFDTYWLIQYEDKLFIMDQHAAHEKVLYERTMRSLAEREYTCQQISPPVVISLTPREEEVLLQYMPQFTGMGFEIEPFGGKEYAIRGVPGNLFGLQDKGLFLDFLDSLAEEGSAGGRAIHEKVASMSCKAAVKGKMQLSFAEANALIDELLTLENPYACPHGRPTIISMSRYELEKKFRRIV